jgi:hypothetical protein
VEGVKDQAGGEIVWGPWDGFEVLTCTSTGVDDRPRQRDGKGQRSGI